LLLQRGEQEARVAVEIDVRAIGGDGEARRRSIVEDEAEVTSIGRAFFVVSIRRERDGERFGGEARALVCLDVGDGRLRRAQRDRAVAMDVARCGGDAPSVIKRRARAVAHARARRYAVAAVGDLHAVRGVRRPRGFVHADPSRTAVGADAVERHLASFARVAARRCIVRVDARAVDDRRIARAVDEGRIARTAALRAAARREQERAPREGERLHASKLPPRAKYAWNYAIS